MYPRINTMKWQGTTYGLAAVSRLSDVLSEPLPVEGMSMCIKLSRKGSCSTPKSLCAGDSGCVFAMFNAERSCCPASVVQA